MRDQNVNQYKYKPNLNSKTRRRKQFKRLPEYTKSFNKAGAKKSLEQ